MECVGNKITYATTRPDHKVKAKAMAVMVGGIPRDPERQRALPLINKLHGALAIELSRCGYVGTLYNQPGTGQSQGDLATETLAFRAATLETFTANMCRKLRIGRVAFIGMSAGSYLAIKASNRMAKADVEVSHLILQSPPAFPPLAEEIPYGQQFRETLANWDFTEAPIFRDLTEWKTHNKPTYISYFEADNPPIPDTIQAQYRNFAERFNADGKPITFEVIEGVAHNFRRISAGANDRNVIDNDAIRASAAHLIDFLS